LRRLDLTPQEAFDLAVDRHRRLKRKTGNFHLHILIMVY
jgi:hypothetical protein